MGMAQIRPARRAKRSAGTTRFLLRLPPALHQTLTAQAAAEGLSLNEYCVRRLGAMGGPLGSAVDVVALVERAVAVARDAFVGLMAHGSVVRGEATTSSDFDVLIVVQRHLPLTRDLYRRWDALTPSDEGTRVDAHFIHLPEDAGRASSVWCEAAIEGVVLVDGKGLIARTLIDVRRAIGEGRLVRKRVHGQPYWTVAA